MHDALLAHEPLVRLTAFGGVFSLMALWEVLRARRPLRVSRGKRWLANLGLVAVNGVVLRLVFPSAAVGMAMLASERGWGLLHAVEVPEPVAVALAMLLLDLAIYLQHVVFHAVPALWRLHRVHHADLDFDVTTGSRFHPIEIVLSMGIKLGVVSALGAPAVAVLAFEVLLNASSMFNHGNVSLPPALDRVLRRLLVTPDMHRVHHSIVVEETNSNFGFALPWWDRLFGTYRDQPAAGHDAMTIGLAALQEARPQNLHWLLTFPFERLPPQASPPGHRHGDSP